MQVARGGSCLQESKESSFKLTLTNAQLVVTSTAPIPIRKTVSDGQWHAIELNRNVVYVDSAGYGKYYFY